MVNPPTERPVSALLGAPGLDGVRHLAGPLDARPVIGVRLVEDLRALAGQPAGSVVVLSAAASARATGYRLDVALRDCVAAGAAALVLTCAGEPLAATAAALADRGALAVLSAATSPGGDLAGLVVAVERAVAGSAADALARVEAATSAVLRAGGDPERIAAAASRALGVAVRTGPPGSGPGRDGAFSAGLSDVADGARDGAADGHLERAVRVVLEVAALAAARGEPDDIPVRSRSQLLAELLIAPEEQALRLAARARALGMAVDSWHIALRVEPAELAGTERYAVLDAAGPLAMRLLRSAGGPDWNLARADDALIVIRTQPADPGRQGLRAAVADAERLLGHLRARLPEAGLRCGVSGAHRGPLGLRTSAREARSALLRDPAARSPVTAHDVAGLDRMLIEWYSSEAARQAVRELLAPLTALGPTRAEPLLRTLQCYLDHQGSPARVAEELHLHRNAVSQRIRKIEELLGADLDDPQQRLALQLACRAARIRA
ncbi:PucR family transcriptional regulator [Microtetraspora fusca]|uniref:PucR family transcriptional regulator n=1 Tax=Microtetraspora fusca TaxID=1997 RepID=UPI0008368ED4|nr:helix-turn-helix domain-containing protein [Microtetraspora fusca]